MSATAMPATARHLPRYAVLCPDRQVRHAEPIRGHQAATEWAEACCTTPSAHRIVRASVIVGMSTSCPTDLPVKARDLRARRADR